MIIYLCEPAQPYYLKFPNTSGAFKSSFFTSVITDCKSSIFLPDTRTSSPCIDGVTFNFNALMALTISLASYFSILSTIL